MFSFLGCCPKTPDSCLIFLLFGFYPVPSLGVVLPVWSHVAYVQAGITISYSYRGGDGRWGPQGGRFDRQGSAPPPMPQNTRWDALIDDRSRDRRGNVGQGYNRWDNRQDCAQDGKEDWSVPLPRNERLEQ